jgi:hypothetical protein
VVAYDFEGSDGSVVGLTSIGWWLARGLAERFGWRPAGTEPPDDWDAGRPWDGSYTGNSGQLVAAPDARRLAVGLRVALAAPEFGELVGEFEAEKRRQLASASTSTLRLTLRPSAPEGWRQSLEEFAAFCDRGAFRIN